MIMIHRLESFVIAFIVMMIFVGVTLVVTSL